MVSQGLRRASTGATDAILHESHGIEPGFRL
jgi:hypothetical protein